MRYLLLVLENSARFSELEGHITAGCKFMTLLIAIVDVVQGYIIVDHINLIFRFFPPKIPC